MSEEVWPWQPELVSVVVPTYNRLAVLLRVLDGLAAQTLPPSRFEVLVVDDGSTDGTPDQVTAYQASAPYRLTLLRQPNQGPAAARNAGLRQAQGDIVVFLDDDCIPEAGLLAAHVSSHEVAGLVVIGRIDWHPELVVSPFMRYAEPNLFFAYQLITLAVDATFFCLYTGNASVHRATALAIGGFDQRFPRAMYEDLEFGYRLRCHGARFVFNERARVLHYRSAEFVPTLERQRLSGWEALRFWSLHPELHLVLPCVHMLEPLWRRHFYRVMLGYFLLLGAQEALAEPGPLDPHEGLPADFEDVAEVWVDERLAALYVAINQAHAERQATLVRLEAFRQRAEELDEAHRRLQADYDRQAARAADLDRRLEVARTANPALRLGRRLTHLLTRRNTPPDAASSMGDQTASTAPPAAGEPSLVGPHTLASGSELVSVVVPTYNRLAVLLRVLDGLAAQTLPPSRVEVLVVDDGSTDGTPERVTAYQASAPYRLTLLRQPNQGPAAARNAGLRQAQGDIVVFLDDDCIPEAGLLAAHVSSHEVAGLVVIGRIDWHPELVVSPFTRCAEPHLFMVAAGLPAPFDTPLAEFCASNASIQRAAALAVGGFDEALPARTLEDIDFAYRLRQRGARFLLADQARVARHASADLRAMLDQARARGRQLPRLFEKHPDLHPLLDPARLFNPVVRQDFYDAMTAYYLVLGIQAGLADLARFKLPATLPELFQTAARRWTDRRIVDRGEELERLRRTHQEDQTRLDEVRSWARGIERSLADLQAAFIQQAAWVDDLARRLGDERPQP